MTHPRILIAGIGNIFLGDDAFGVEVIRRLSSRDWPDGVQLMDAGIRGIDLAMALTGSYVTVILIDAIARDQPPGTLYVLQLANDDQALGDPSDDGSPAGIGHASDHPAASLEMHSLDVAKVLQLARAMGGPMQKTLLVGCEPAEIGSPDKPAMGLSPSVRAAVNEAARLVESLVEQTIATKA